MSHNNQQQRYLDLKSLIRKYDYHYYTLDQPLVSDQEYDRLYQELMEIEKTHLEWVSSDSPTQRVSGQVLENFEPLSHQSPMLSLDNVFSPEDFFAFDQRIKKGLGSKASMEYIGEPKLDGLSIELIYEDGLLTGAATRGDGWVGENVTQNVRTIRSIPLSIREQAEKNHIDPPSSFRVRGEVIMTIDDFVALNHYREKKGESLFANPRNAAAGSLRQLNPQITAQRKLKAFFYFLTDYDPLEFTTQWEILSFLKTLGFPVHPETHLLADEKQAVAYHQKLALKRAELNYEIDGTVFKVNHLQSWKQLGSTTRFPRWAVAFKFQAHTAETQLKDIQVHVGRTGTLTPIAILDPVKISGVRVSQATLHNEDEIKRKDIRIGDTVLIQRSGDVIPNIIAVNFSKRPSSAQSFTMPSCCPVCSSPVQKIESQAYIKCINMDCPARIKESIKHFVSKAGLDIPGIGERLIEKFFDLGLIKSSADLFNLKKEDLESLPGFKEKSIQNMLNAIEKAKNPPLWRWIASIGIDGVGEVTSRILAKKFCTLDALMKADEASLIEIDQIGPETAKNIILFFQLDKNIETIERMTIFGLKPLACGAEKEKGINLPLNGKTAVVTGVLKNFTREEAEERLRQLGASVSSSVSSRTSFVLAGDRAGSKAKKADELGVPLMNEDEFLSL